MKRALAFLLIASCGGSGDAVTIFAASSLHEAVSEVAREWTRRTGRPVRFQFHASSALARQIHEGAPADLFVSAAPEWTERMEALERRSWLGNRLAFVVPREGPTPELARLKSLAVGCEEVPVGKYAREALEGMNLRLPERVICGGNTRDVLSKVSTGAAEGGIVYVTDAKIDPEIRVAQILPEENHTPIVYIAALLRPKGAGFFEALREPWALEIARRHGFKVVE